MAVAADATGTAQRPPRRAAARCPRARPTTRVCRHRIAALRSDDALDLPTGTVHPALHRLERAGLIPVIGRPSADAATAPTTSPQPGTSHSASSAPCGTSSPPPSQRSSRNEHGQPSNNHSHPYSPGGRARYVPFRPRRTNYAGRAAAERRSSPNCATALTRPPRIASPPDYHPTRPLRPRSPSSEPQKQSPTRSAANWPPPTPAAPSPGSSLAALVGIWWLLLLHPSPWRTGLIAPWRPSRSSP